MTLGADGVQIGTRFALTEESSAHFTFKDRCLRLNEGDTQLTLKQLSPVRLVKMNSSSKWKKQKHAVHL